MEASIEASFAAAAVQWLWVSASVLAAAAFLPEHCALAAKDTAPKNANNKNNFFIDQIL